MTGQPALPLSPGQAHTPDPGRSRSHRLRRPLGQQTPAALAPGSCLRLAWLGSGSYSPSPSPPPQLQDSPEGMICPKQDPSVLLHRGPDSSRAHLECVPHPSRVSCSLKRGPRAGGTRRGTASVSEVRQGLHTDTFHGRSNTPVPTVPFSPVVRDGTARLLES